MNLPNEFKYLGFRVADGDDDSATFPKLLQQGVRNGGCRGCDDDAIEWCAVRETKAAVTDHYHDVRVPELLKDVFSSSGECGMALDRVDMGCES